MNEQVPSEKMMVAKERLSLALMRLERAIDNQIAAQKKIKQLGASTASSLRRQERTLLDLLEEHHLALTKGK
jgi:hypothetical protein